MSAELEETFEIAGRERRRIRRHHAEDRLHGHRHVVHETSELRRGFGVVR